MKNKLNIPKSFIGFLIASTLIWLIINLSKSYTQTISVVVEYEKLPLDKIFQEDPVHKISLQVRATGFNMLTGNFTNNVVKVPLNGLQKKGGNSYFLLTNSLFLNIQSQLPEGFTLQNVKQDVLYFKLGNLATKKVPVSPNLSIKYKLGFDAVDVVVTPDSIVVSGADAHLKKINSIVLEEMILSDVSENVIKDIGVIHPEKMKELKMSHQNVNVAIKVDKFTEGEFSVPLIVNNMTDEEITIYPKRVKVIFKVGLKNFNKIKKNSFEVVADYKYSKENGLSYLVPKLKTNSGLVSNIRIVPEKVEFLINK